MVANYYQGRKSLTAPASLEKLTLSWLRESKLAPSLLKQNIFKRQPQLFISSPDDVIRRKTACNPIPFIFLLKITIKFTTDFFYNKVTTIEPMSNS